MVFNFGFSEKIIPLNGKVLSRWSQGQRKSMGFSQVFHSYIPVFWAMRLLFPAGNHQSTVFLEEKWERWNMQICLGSPIDEPSANWNQFVFLLFFSHHLPFISMPLVAICHARRITITSWWPTASSVKAVAKGYRLQRPKLSNSFWICNALQCRQEGKCLGSMEWFKLTIRFIFS